MVGFMHMLINITIQAGILAVVIMIFRFAFRKAPKWINCLLWGVVGLRLILPFSIETMVGLLPQKDVIQPGGTVYLPGGDTGIVAISQMNDRVNSVVISNSNGGGTAFAEIAFAIWIIGLVVMLTGAVVSCIKLKKRIGASTAENGIYICDYIDTPFIFGVFRPRIYIPSGTDNEYKSVIIAHEKAHISRKDNLWKPLGYLILSVYWFNPVLWIAYYLFCKDIETACDEKVIKNMSIDEKIIYSQALLENSKERKFIYACPVAFGEVGVKQRIKSALNYKKPAFLIVAAALIVSVAIAICFTTKNKKSIREATDISEQRVSEIILEHNSGSYKIGECAAEGHIILRSNAADDKSTVVYALVSYAEYGFINGRFVPVSGGNVPAVITMYNDSDEYLYKEPGDGTDYVKDIKKMFPKEYYGRIMNTTAEDEKSMRNQEEAYARDYLEKISRNAEICSYGELNLQLLPVSAEISNTISNLNLPYPSYIGNCETIENETRYVYETDYDKDKNLICFKKYRFDTGLVESYMEINSLTGDIISVNSHPEKDNNSESVSVHNSHPENEHSREKAVYYSLIEQNNMTELSAEKSEQVRKIISKYKIETFSWDNISDYNIKADDVIYYYDSDSGIITKDDTHADKLSDSDRKLLNSIIGVKEEPDIISPSAEGDYDEIGLRMYFIPNGNSKGTLVLSQSTKAGKPDGELMTGPDYGLEKYENGKWVEVKTLDGYPLTWNAIAYTIPLDDEMRTELDFANAYGALSSGRYRIVKKVNIYREPGDYDNRMCYAEFTV